MQRCAKTIKLILGNEKSAEKNIQLSKRRIHYNLLAIMLNFRIILYKVNEILSFGLEIVQFLLLLLTITILLMFFKNKYPNIDLLIDS